MEGLEAGTCRAVWVGHAAMVQAEAVENVVALYSAPGAGDDADVENCYQNSSS